MGAVPCHTQQERCKQTGPSWPHPTCHAADQGLHSAGVAMLVQQSQTNLLHGHACTILSMAIASVLGIITYLWAVGSC